MSHEDKIKLFTIIALITAVFFTLMAVARDARAEADEEYTVIREVPPDEYFGLNMTPVPQVVTFTVLPTATPKPVYKEQEALPSYDLNKKDVEIIARLLWCSPLRDSTNKTRLIWCVLNRVRKGSPFGTTIAEVVNTREFPWFDRKARVSDRNRELVENEMNRFYAFYDGYGIGYHPSTKGLYVRFVGENNRQCELLSDPYGEKLN